MKYIRQIIYEMSHQKMMTWVSVGGTALSIFLVMAFFMADQVKTVDVAPESNRSRILCGQNIEIKSTDPEKNYSSSGGASYETIKRLYEGLDGVDKVSYMSNWADTYNVNVAGKKPVVLNGFNTDEEFWKLYDFRFIDGKPYDKASCDDGEKKVVLTRSAARMVFQEENVVGKEVLIQHVPYTVCGLVEDVSPLLTATSADLYIPLGPEQRKSNGYRELMGNVKAHLLMSEGADEKQIQKQVESRYATLGNTLKEKQEEVVYHGQPYNAEILASDIYSNATPDLTANHRERYVVYLIMLILPAINLSSMTRSRLRHRVSEIGVRRAFGAPRRSIISQMLTENFIITLLGGIIGLVLSVIFMIQLYDVFFAYNTDNSLAASTKPSLEMLFTWKSFFIALAFCFVLNLLSAFVPAWKASRINPAMAISKSR